MINIKELKIDELKPFEDSPFEFREDEGFSQLLESISESGVISPIVVCERNDRFEIISGYRRVEACKRLNIDVIPAIVKELSREEAIVLHVDSNFQRDKILPSEKAYGYKMKLEAMKRQGFRSDLTSDQPGRKLESAEIVANDTDDSKSQVRRYIRLTFLIPELLKLVDEGRIAFTPAVEMSFLTEDEQRVLAIEMEGADATPSLSQAQRIRKLSAENMLRHTYCSMLQWSGVDIKVAQELMGHSEYEVTANVYTHNNEDSKKNAAVLQGEFLRNTFMKKEE